MPEKKKRIENTLTISFKETDYELKLKEDIKTIGKNKFGMSAWIKEACAEKLYREGMPEYISNSNKDIKSTQLNSNIMDIDLGL